MKRLKLLLLFILMELIFWACSSGNDWRTASRESARIAPDPSITKEAVLQVYGAAAWGWRNYRGQSVLRITQDVPDRYWYGKKPRILKAYSGKGVDELIYAVDKAARAYPWKNDIQGISGSQQQHLHRLDRQASAGTRIESSLFCHWQ